MHCSDPTKNTDMQLLSTSCNLWLGHSGQDQQQAQACSASDCTACTTARLQLALPHSLQQQLIGTHSYDVGRGHRQRAAAACWSGRQSQLQGPCRAPGLEPDCQGPAWQVMVPIYSSSWLVFKSTQSLQTCDAVTSSNNTVAVT